MFIRRHNDIIFTSKTASQPHLESCVPREENDKTFQNVDVLITSQESGCKMGNIALATVYRFQRYRLRFAHAGHVIMATLCSFSLSNFLLIADPTLKQPRMLRRQSHRPRQSGINYMNLLQQFCGVLSFPSTWN